MPGFASPFCQNRIASTARIRDTPPTIFHAEASRAAGDLEMIRESFKKYRETSDEDRRGLLDRYRLVDAAIKVVGVGSVGTLCMVALMVSVTDNPLLLRRSGRARHAALWAAVRAGSAEVQLEH